jgi:hypothetical protein
VQYPTHQHGVVDLSTSASRGRTGGALLTASWTLCDQFVFHL